MAVALILALLLAIGASIFSSQNAVPVTVAFFRWKFEASLAIVILLSVLCGVLMAVMIFIPMVVKKTWVLSRLKRQLQTQERLSKELSKEEPEIDSVSRPPLGGA